MQKALLVFQINSVRNTILSEMTRRGDAVIDERWFDFREHLYVGKKTGIKKAFEAREMKALFNLFLELGRSKILNFTEESDREDMQVFLDKFIHSYLNH